MSQTLPVDAPAPRTRRSPRLVVAGVVVLSAGLALTVALYNAQHARRSVAVAAVPVRAGETLRADQLRVVDVDGLPATAAIPADRLEGILGKPTAGDLRPGDVVPSSLTDAVNREGIRRVGIRLAAGHYPASLRTGQLVRLIPSDGDTTSEAVQVSVTGTVSRGPDGGVSFDAEVPTPLAAGLVQRVVTGRLVATGVTGK